MAPFLVVIAILEALAMIGVALSVGRSAKSYAAGGVALGVALWWITILSTFVRELLREDEGFGLMVVEIFGVPLVGGLAAASSLMKSRRMLREIEQSR